MKFIMPLRKKRRKLYNTEKRLKLHSFNNFIGDGERMQSLKIECERLWNMYGGDRDYAKSFWIAADATPRCALEAFAKECALFHYPSYVGAEFWVQIRSGKCGDGDSEMGLDFHFDKDENTFKSDDIWIHPLISTVTYLDTNSSSSYNDSSVTQTLLGAPLVVFNTTSQEIPPHLHFPPSTYLPRRSWIYWPTANNHVAFAGNLLHGVASELMPFLYANNTIMTDKEYIRISLPVNIWHKEKPRNVNELNIEEVFSYKKESKYSNVNFVNMSCRRNKMRNVSVEVDTSNEPERDFNESESNRNEKDIEVDNSIDRKVQKIGSHAGLVSETASSDLYYINQHVSGDTGPIPLHILTEEWNKCLHQANGIGDSIVGGMHISYKRKLD